jgi:hypothetical protein
MSIHWGSLLTVFVASLGATVAVVVLVALALLGVSARTAPAGPTRLFSPAVGTAVAGVCLAGATGIVLLGLWVLVAR